MIHPQFLLWLFAGATPSPSPSPSAAPMSPQVTAAWIAAGGVVLTVIATVLVQITGRRLTSRDTQKALEEQRKQLDRTLAEQRTRTLNERFATAAGQLGSDKPPEVRLAGVYAMAGLADDWQGNQKNQQTCVDVLCAYLRMPYKPDPGGEAFGPEQLAFRASREVRHAVIRVIAAHLQPDAAAPWKGLTPWKGLNLDFTGVVSGGGSTVTFAGAEFSGGKVTFAGARFAGALVSFSGARFSGADVSFAGAEFSGGTVDFNNVGDWSHPPAFPWTDTPPPGVKLPRKEDQSQT